MAGQHPLGAVWREIDSRAIGDLRSRDGRNTLPSNRVPLRRTVREQQVIGRGIGADEGASRIRCARNEVVETRHQNAATVDSHLGNVIDQQLAPVTLVDAGELAQVDATGVLAITDHGQLARPLVEHAQKLRQ